MCVRVVPWTGRSRRSMCRWFVRRLWSDLRSQRWGSSLHLRSSRERRSWLCCPLMFRPRWSHLTLRHLSSYGSSSCYCHYYYLDSFCLKYIYKIKNNNKNSDEKGCTWWGSNPRPSPCKGDVITTTLHVLSQLSTLPSHSNHILRFETSSGACPKIILGGYVN